jgi:hypothetical protein
MSVTGLIVKRLLRILFQKAISRPTEDRSERRLTMTQAQQTRDERLAAKLRENLRRRKVQARALASDAPASASEASAGDADSAAAGESNAENESAGLSKPAPES